MRHIRIFSLMDREARWDSPRTGQTSQGQATLSKMLLLTSLTQNNPKGSRDVAVFLNLLGNDPETGKGPTTKSSS